MYTSNFANVQKIVEAGLRPVAISIGLPKTYKGEREFRLAPTWAMLKMTREAYDRIFLKKLASLDPVQLYQSLGEDAVLLCFEKHNDWCHRRLVAEWFESALGIVVPEFGFDRSKTLPYCQCGIKKKDNDSDIQGSLF
ncbi:MULTISPECIES: hypothetical protein [unclassified Thermoactinomyces]|uniref:hypothetical protein n=1 Tax=unclassified Thermoactinomyces TaxID=2634588 RepID=UPI0018DEB1DB|nr:MULTISPECIES: hypothetical protein [unclassified Thermoactinomyces]MBH8599088.1 hypothetical protein [Thermoactinomyces sp. CICC 10523]MBH8607981.1 hypothetical protein [Thermoactinomyces sp. CICC 10521]